jgi:Zn-dependent M28 family amino/carboxypeptidase
MQKTKSSLLIFSLVLAAALTAASPLLCQSPPVKKPLPALKTPLSQETLDMLANEISGQIVFNNEVMLAGAPWIRDQKEFTETWYEAQKIYEIARSYGIESVDLVHYPRDRKLTYPLQGEFWMIKPNRRLIARLEADAALIASGSESVDLTGSLVYIPPLTGKEVKEWKEAGIKEEYKGKIALMWSHAYRNVADALDAAGVRGVISFNTRERYFDPAQVVYSRGSYTDKENLKFGFSISWRQWSELLEDVESGQKITVRCKTKLGEYQDKFDHVFCWIPGSEPEKKGVIFTAHLFEGYTKRGANDNMSGCVVQLEILRALTKLIAQEALPQPRRTIYFLWPNEISGTYEHIKQNPEMVDKWSININMDMVGEGLRKNNALFTMTECPNYLPSYQDALCDSIMNYVWRTNDIVYLPDSPRGRRGGQYFPIPMWEKNGSRDAFRYSTHLATGGSDHICFNNPMVGIPGIELNIWPDQWYHADTDTPDKSDPTQLKRTAFIGAAMAWAAANCTDEVLDVLLEKVSTFGYARVGQRELPKALGFIEQADAENLQEAFNKAVNLVDLATTREAGAVGSTTEIYTASDEAVSLVKNYQAQWKFYQEALNQQLQQFAAMKAKQLKVEAPVKAKPTAEEASYAKLIPAIHPEIKATEFSLERSDNYQDYMEKNPDALKDLKLLSAQRRMILNYINGKRSILEIRRWVMAETGRDLELDKLVRYIEFMKTIGWVTY